MINKEIQVQKGRLKHHLPFVETKTNQVYEILILQNNIKAY